MKINNIYIYTYTFLILIFIPIWFILKPQEKDITIEQQTTEVTYIEVGDIIPINHKELRKNHDYDDIKMISMLRQVALVCLC
jgi:hypothetical protein